MAPKIAEILWKYFSKFILQKLRNIWKNPCWNVNGTQKSKEYPWKSVSILPFVVCGKESI